MAVGRIAFALGLEGPAIPVDLVCASSHASVHQAVKSLENSEVDMALAGGVNAVLSEPLTEYMTDLGMLSLSGESRPFDAGADGFVRGEGCGMLVLKRLSDAEADGDRNLGRDTGFSNQPKRRECWCYSAERPGAAASYARRFDFSRN